MMSDTEWREMVEHGDFGHAGGEMESSDEMDYLREAEVVKTEWCERAEAAEQRVEELQRRLAKAQAAFDIMCNAVAAQDSRLCTRAAKAVAAALADKKGEGE